MSYCILYTILVSRIPSGSYPFLKCILEHSAVWDCIRYCTTLRCSAPHYVVSHWIHDSLLHYCSMTLSASHQWFNDIITLLLDTKLTYLWFVPPDDLFRAGMDLQQKTTDHRCRSSKKELWNDPQFFEAFSQLAHPNIYLYYNAAGQILASTIWFDQKRHSTFLKNDFQKPVWKFSSRFSSQAYDPPS